MIAAVIAIVSLVGYFRSTTVNAVTGEKQHVGGISPDQEIALGIQAAPQMEQQYGGESQDSEATKLVQDVGAEIAHGSDAAKTPYNFQYHLLADTQTINAFALPGGQVFITQALLKRLKTRGQLAGVLGHETGHVVARHSAQQIAKQQLTQGLTGAAVLASYNSRNGGMGSAAVAALIGQLVTLRFSRQDELQADELGVRFESQAGYDPRAMIGVMQVLKEASGSRTVDFFSTHPNPDNRIDKIKAAIAAEFPNGVPSNLKP
jgi:predicted Zn-dependent protease